MDTQDRFLGCLLGLACGDAVGTTVEFKPRGTFMPLTDMVGGGPFNLEAGQWTDDTSMALCLASSLLENGGFDARDQMARYCRWRSQGYWSSNGRCFDIGNTVSQALRRFELTDEPISGSTAANSAGNGSIMRLAPIPMFYFADDLATVEQKAAASSVTTHGAVECVDACRLLVRILVRALSGQSKEAVLFGDSDSFAGSEKIVAIARGKYQHKLESDIRGIGYVVVSLEAALWCFYQTDTFEHAILLAANLGDDADTTAAICGQVAGAFYGESGIPATWLARLTLRKEISQLAERLYQRAMQTGEHE
ncbi:ADP-ribosylglycohydrolase family protein [Oceanisphaera sp. IT1-181]|uniref:ADP-ribosylglycohydrolase family protein n=1 Tax=Oceanisphaera sp. IT1-181 TaxID=3081199 RepID=UPI0029CA5331|nr:ADP-ribosylglycohydrolase family protein [Oceanisphaera sp. IT1-181]